MRRPRRPFPKLTDVQKRRAELLGICTSTLHVRLHRGWTAEEATGRPAREYGECPISYARAPRSRRDRYARILRRVAQERAVELYLQHNGLDIPGRHTRTPLTMPTRRMPSPTVPAKDGPAY